MTRLFLVLAGATCFSCNNPASAPEAPAQKPDTTVQKEPVSSAATPDETPAPDSIAAIRTIVTRINTESLTKEHVEFVCDEKMTVDYFYRGNEIVKVAVDFGTVGDTYAKEDYYYNNGQLVFKYEFVEGGPACEGCISTHEYRSYIQDNKVIRYLKDKKTQNCRTCSFSSSSKEIRVLKAKTGDEVKQVFCR